MKNIVMKYFHVSGEIAFRLWMFANAVEELKRTPNQEKANNLRSKMKAFSKIIGEEGTETEKEDIEALIEEL